MEKVKVLIAFYSRNGSSEALAKAVAQGAGEEGAEVRLRRVREVVGPEVMALAPGWTENAERMNDAYPAPTPEDVEWADVVVFGGPTRYGVMSSELKAFIDSLGALWAAGKLVNKVGGAFSTTSTPHGGNEMTILSMLTPMMHFGMIIVPTGYTDPLMFAAGSPYGATAVVPQGSSGPGEEDLNVARHQGRRVTEVAASLRAGSGREAMML